jgi:hypothetical protein
MDFHLALLKKISPGKTVERAQFVTNMATVKIFFSIEINYDPTLSLHIDLIKMMEINWMNMDIQKRKSILNFEF